MNQELAKALNATTTTLTATSTMTTTLITTTLTKTTIITTISLMVVAIENVIGRGRMTNNFSTEPSEPQWSLWWRRFRIPLSCSFYYRKIDQSWLSHKLQNSCCICKRGRWNDLPLKSEIIKKLVQQCTVLFHTVYYIITDIDTLWF